MAAVPSTSAQKLWCLVRMEIASAGVVGHNPEIARRKPSDLLTVPYVVRLFWMLVSKVKLRLTILKINRAIVIILLGEGFPYSKSVISTTQLARLNWTSIYRPRWLEANMIRCQESTSEFPNKPLVLVGGLVSKRKLQKNENFQILLMEKIRTSWYW